MFPHDEEDGGADEAELDGAGEEEGAAALMKIVHHLRSEHERFLRTEGEKLALSQWQCEGPVSVCTNC